MTGKERWRAWEKRIPKRHPKFIWLSFLGLNRIGIGQSDWAPEEKGGLAFRYTVTTGMDDAYAALKMGYTARLMGYMIGVVMLPGVLMCQAMDRMPEPWATVWNCFILLYVYLAGVFLTDHLYNYCYRWWYRKQYGEILYHKGDSQ